MLLLNEYVLAVYEYAPSKLLVYAYNSKLLLILDNWQAIHEIKDPNPGNIYKCWISTVPLFDTETFPFIIVSGYESYNIVNVKNGKM